MNQGPAYRIGMGIAIAAALIAIGLLGALVTRFRPGGMAAALFAMALAQALVTAIALFGNLGRPYSGSLKLLGLNGFFIAMFIGSALLFRRAGRGRAEATA